MQSTGDAGAVRGNVAVAEGDSGVGADADLGGTASDGAGRDLTPDGTLVDEIIPVGSLTVDEILASFGDMPITMLTEEGTDDPY